MRKPRQTVRFIAIFLLLCVVCIVPLLTNYYASLTHTVTIGADTVKTSSGICLSESVAVSQVIYLQGTLKDLQFFLTTAGLAPEDAAIHFRAIQGSYAEDAWLPVADIRSGYNTVPISPQRFVPGEMTLEITTEHCGREPGAAVWMSGEIGPGLPNASVNGQMAERCLALQFSIFQTPPLFIYKTAMLVGLVILCMLTAALLAWKSDWLDRKNWILVMLAFAMVVIVVGIRAPQASFFGEPFSEAAYDFWQGQTERGLRGSLMTLESGLYLSWMQRIVTFIAVKLFPIKYVFVGMQLLMLCFVAGVSASFCVKRLRRFFHPLAQLMLSLFVGLFLLGQQFYMFHTLGYWGIFFILFFCIYQDMEKMPRWLFLGGLGFTAVICLSKLLYAALLPVAVFILLVTFKEKRPRLKFYWTTVIAAILFHVFFIFYTSGSAIATRDGFASFLIPPIPRLIENILYYQVQFLNAVFTNKTFSNALMANVLFLGLVIAIALFLLYHIFITGKYRSLCLYLTSCGLFSLGVIGIDILSGVGTTDMRSKVDWTVSFIGYNQHYLFIYVALAFMGLGALSFFCRYLEQHLSLTDYHGCGSRCAAISVSIACLLCMCLQFSPSPYYGVYTELDEFPTEWSMQWQVTQREAYYLPINVGYYALTSMCHNSRGVLLGYDYSGQWREMAILDQGLDANRVYFEGSVQSLEHERILSLTVRKANTNFRTHYTMLLYDANGQLIASVPQSNSDYRQWITFQPEKPVYGAVRVAFVFTNNGAPAPVRDGLNIGVVQMPA